MKGVRLPLLGLLLSGLLHMQAQAGGEATQRLSERSYRQLSSVHALMQQQRYDEALARLDRLQPRMQHNPHEHALLLQTYGYLFANTEQYQRAVDALEESLALRALPQPATERSLYALAQLQMAVEDYPAALTSLEQWLDLVADPAPAAHALAGAVYAQLRRYREAVAHLKRAIDGAGEPQEIWYRQLLAVYYQSEQYGAAVPLLQQMKPQLNCYEFFSVVQMLHIQLNLGSHQ